jgi:hypothetical protein
MTSFRKIFVLAVIGLGASAGFFEFQVLAPQRALLASLRVQADRLTHEVTQARMEAENAQHELASARQELAAWRTRAAEVADSPNAAATKGSWLARTRQLQQLFAQRPEQRIPELSLLTDRDWLSAAMTADLNSDEGQRKALGAARSIAKGEFVQELGAALRRYAAANQGMLPTDILQLVPDFDSPPDLAMLQRYRLKRTGLASEVSPRDEAIEETGLIDEQFDSRYHVDARGNYGAQSVASGVDPTIALAVKNAFKAFLKDHPEGPPKDNDASVLLPYFNPPLDPAQQKKFLDLATKAKDD